MWFGRPDEFPSVLKAAGIPPLVEYIRADVVADMIAAAYAAEE